MTTQDEKEDVVCDLALIQPLNGLYIGQLTLTEMEAFSRLRRMGLADTEYSGGSGFLGLGKIKLLRLTQSE